MSRLWVFLLFLAAVVGFGSWWLRQVGPIQGIVVDANGNPVSSASVHLERDFGEAAFDLEHWYRLWSNRATTDKEGAFTIPDPGRRGRYRIVVDDRESVVNHREVVRGETGIKVTLEPGWTVTGEVLWDETLEVDGLLVGIQPQGMSKGIDFGHSDGVKHDARSFKIRQVESQACAMMILPTFSSHPVSREELELGAGGGTIDVGLIDLRGGLKTASLQLTPEDDSDLFFADAIDLDGVRMGSEVDGKIPIVFAKDSLDLVIIARGYRNTEVKDVRGDREVFLKRGIPIEIAFDVVVGIPEEWVVEIILIRQADANDKETPGDYWNGQALSSTWSNRFFMPAPGTYKVMVGMYDHSAATAENGYPSPFTYFSTEADAPTITVLEQEETQHFHVPVDQKAARAAILRLRHMDWPGRQ